MAEFVELQVEELLPLIEELVNVELLQPDEVTHLTKQIRRYEYRLRKPEKRVVDYLHYVEYMKDLLKLIKKRRKTLDFKHRFKTIEKPLLEKISGLYMKCVIRFKGNMTVWREALDFFKKEHLRRHCSEAFAMLIQFNFRNVDIRCEAAEWEFTENNSVENARTALQLALRLDNKEIKYWASLFKVEVLFVKKMQDRLLFLKTWKPRKDDKRGMTAEELETERQMELEQASIKETPDEVMQFKVAEIVISQARKAIEDRSRLAELYLMMWRSAREAGEPAKKLEAQLYEELNQFTEPGTAEYARLALIQKESEESDVDTWDAFAKALEVVNTEKMYRMFIEYCDAVGGDGAKLEVQKARRQMIKNGYANLEDTLIVVDSFSFDSELTEDAQQLRDLMLISIQAYSDCAKLWESLLSAELRLLDEVTDSELLKKKRSEIAARFNEAFEKVPSAEQLSLWKLAIDFAIQHRPQTVEKVFDQGIVTSDRQVSSELKVIRLNYLEATGDVDLVRRESRTLISKRPNSTCVYAQMSELELQREVIDHSLVLEAWDAAVSENRNDCDAWFGYIEYLMKFAPEKVGEMHQRATLSLSASDADQFNLKWIKLRTEAAKEGVSRNL